MEREKKLMFYFPRSVNEALGIARKYPHYQYWAGGTTQSSHKLIDTDGLIMLKLIEEMSRPARSEYSLELGSMMPLQEIVDLGPTTVPPCLKEAILKLADWPVRNKATLGGNLCQRKAIGDLRPVLNILDAYVETRHFSLGHRRKKLIITSRKIPLNMFNGVESLHPGELILRLYIPLIDWTFSAYEKIFYGDDNTKFMIFASLLRVEKGTIGEWRMLISDGEKFIHRPRDLELYASGRPFPLGQKDMEMIIQGIKKLELPWPVDSYERVTTERLSKRFLTRVPHINPLEHFKGNATS